MFLFGAPRIRRLGIYLCIGLLFALLIGAVAAAHPAMPFIDALTCLDCDVHTYLHLALGHRVGAPFGYRLLAPTLARILPLPLDVAFTALTYLYLWLCCVLMFVILRRYRIGLVGAIAGIGTMLSLYWFAPFLCEEPYLVDALAMVFILLAIYAALTRRPTLFLVALTFGALAKESVLFTAPLWISLGCERDRVRRAVLLAVPAVLVLVTLRIAMPPGNYSYAELPGIILPLRIARAEPITEYVPFGVLPLLALATQQGRAVLCRFAPFIALVYMQIFFAGDTGRLFVIAFPPVIVAALEARMLIEVGEVRREWLRVLRPEGWIIATAARKK